MTESVWFGFVLEDDENGPTFEEEDMEAAKEAA